MTMDTKKYINGDNSPVCQEESCFEVDNSIRNAGNPLLSESRMDSMPL